MASEGPGTAGALGRAGPGGGAHALGGGGDDPSAAHTPEITPAVRLQILTTEHWSLLATRSMSWNEAFSRTGMFLSLLSGAVVALALVAQATAFGEGFTLFALLLLPVVLFVGIATYVRLVEINEEDARWVAGMNVLRHAYLEQVPELERYFITGTTDDKAGVMQTFGATPGPGTFAHQFVTTPGMLAVVDAVLAGVLAGVVAMVLDTGANLRMGTPLMLVVGVAVFLISIALLFAYQYRAAVRLSAGYQPRYPAK
jgi:hypothetical protein